MAKIKQKVNISEEESSKIRKVWDNNTNHWQYSITDIMGILTESVDARNYWKTLKNRLKTSQNQLVMNCNQLKMRANDGKYYLVDTADADTLIKIIQLIAPYNVTTFKSYFDHIEVKTDHQNQAFPISKEQSHLSEEETLGVSKTEISTGIKIPLDIFEDKDKIIVKILVPGFDSESLFISTNIDTLTIKGNLKSFNSTNKESYLYQELKWGEFFRKINLPNLIEIEQIEATENRGLITITLTKIDRNKTRYIKIYSK